MSVGREQKYLLHNWSDCSHRNRPQIARVVLSVRLAGAIATKRTGQQNFSTRRSEKAWRLEEALNKYADESLTQPKGILMLWTIIAILVVLWHLGFIGHVGGSLIHLLLVVAVVVVIIKLSQGRRGL